MLNIAHKNCIFYFLTCAHLKGLIYFNFTKNYMTNCGFQHNCNIQYVITIHNYHKSNEFYSNIAPFAMLRSFKFQFFPTCPQQTPLNPFPLQSWENCLFPGSQISNKVHVFMYTNNKLHPHCQNIPSKFSHQGTFQIPDFVHSYSLVKHWE